MQSDFTPVKVNDPIVTSGQNCWRVGDYYITAQPTDPAGLNTAKSLGIQSVVCLRDATEANEPPFVPYGPFLPFDPKEDITLTGLGMNFVNIPFPHTTTLTQTLFNIRAGSVLAVMRQLPKPLLLHCSSGDRASALWAIHLIVDCGLTNTGAIYYAKMSGLEVFLPFVEGFVK